LELETQVLIARDLGYIDESICVGVGQQIKKLACTLNGLINRVQEGIASGLLR
jgi:hypothetical protein